MCIKKDVERMDLHLVVYTVAERGGSILYEFCFESITGIYSIPGLQMYYNCSHTPSTSECLSSPTLSIITCHDYLLGPQLLQHNIMLPTNVGM